MIDRLKRMIAFLIDWNILFLPAFLLCYLISYLVFLPEAAKIFFFLLLIVIVFGTVLLIAARDIVFRGRSLGKRIFGLYVVDKKTLDPISMSRRFVRTVFFFLINWIEVILLLATGETIGDRVATAQVLSKQTLEMRRTEQAIEQDTLIGELSPVAPPAPRKRISKKQVILVVSVLLAAILAFVGLIQISLHSVRDTEEARLAYAYVIESDAFAASGIDASALRMKSYSGNGVIKDGKIVTTAEISFTARLRTFRVICHMEDGVWTVCEECTSLR